METKRFLKGSLRSIASFSTASTCMIMLLFFIGVSLCSINMVGAQECPSSVSQITLTDELCVEIQDGVLVDNFEYEDYPYHPYRYGWYNPPIPYPIWGGFYTIVSI